MIKLVIAYIGVDLLLVAPVVGEVHNLLVARRKVVSPAYSGLV